MKKTLCLLLAAIMALAMVGCGGNDTSKDASSAPKQSQTESVAPDESVSTSAEPTTSISNVETVDQEIGGVKFRVPKEWPKQDDDSQIYYYPDSSVVEVNEMIMVTYSAMDEMTSDNVGKVLDAYADGMATSDDVDDLNKEPYAELGVDALRTTHTQTIDGVKYRITSYILPVNTDGIFFIAFASNGKAKENYQPYYDQILDSIEFPSPKKDTKDTKSTDNTSVADNVENTPDTSKTSEQETSLTTEQSSALEMADRYLEYTSFSHDGLVDQLEYEGFSTEDATYAADNCGADWNEQAAKKAQSYRDMQAFSHKGLVDQLKYEGFTAEQAEYGASATE